MKRIYKTLVEAIPQAKRGSRNAQYKSLIDWLRVGRGVRVISVVAILLSALWLAACGDNTSAERSSGNGPENNGDKTDNPSAGQEQGMSDEVMFGAENIEKAGQTAGYSILKEAAESEYLTEDGESLDPSIPTVQIIQEDLGGEQGNYLMATITQSMEDGAKDGTKTQVAAVFEIDDENFDANFSDKDERAQAIEELEKGQLEGLSIDQIFYQDFRGVEEDVDWIKESAADNPEESADNLNKIWGHLPELLKTSPNNLSLVKSLPESSNPSNNEPTTETEPASSASQDQYQSESEIEGQEISDIDNSELDGTAEKREQYLDKGARELAVGVLDKLIEEDSATFIPAGEEANEIQPPEENFGYYKNHDLSTLQSDVKINVFHAKPSGEEDILVVSAAKGEDENEVISFYPSEDFDMADYDLEQLRDLIKNDPETLEFEGASISSPGEHGEYSYGPISIDEVEDSDIKTFIDKAKTMAEEDFGVEVQ